MAEAARDTADSHVARGPDPQGVCGCVFGNTCSLRALGAAWRGPYCLPWDLAAVTPAFPLSMI